ncbi:hypothetical protein SAMN05414139_02326 [Burkholderia sp. D7]|nr:hypothetical protein SAMN05414139_02326 [Burkholderia sp. D7]
MDIRPLHTKDDHRAALAEVSELVDLDPEAGTPEGDRLDVLSILVERYEAGHGSLHSKKPKLADLLAQCDPSAPYAGEVWAEAQPVGREFGAPVGDDATPLERLRDTVQRYGNPTDPVWPLNDKS